LPYDAAAVPAAAASDGLSVWVTTAARTASAAWFFAPFKPHKEVELAHPPWKRPWRVHAVFLKPPRRVEAWVHLRRSARTASSLLPRSYRLPVEPEAPPAEQGTPTETLRRAWATYTLDMAPPPRGGVVYPTRWTPRQRGMRQRWHFATRAQLLCCLLPHHPP
jgi:hypothetical protein